MFIDEECKMASKTMLSNIQSIMDDFLDKASTIVNEEQLEELRSLAKDCINNHATKPQKKTATRSKSAYNFFFKEQRPIVLQDSPELSNTEIIKRLGALWKQAKADGTTGKYEDLAKADKELFAQNNPNPKPKAKANDKSKTKRPPTAYLLFCKDMAATLKQSKPELKGPALLKHMGACWRQAKEDNTHLDYVNKAEALKAEMKSTVEQPKPLLQTQKETKQVVDQHKIDKLALKTMKKQGEKLFGKDDSDSSSDTSDSSDSSDTSDSSDSSDSEEEPTPQPVVVSKTKKKTQVPLLKPKDNESKTRVTKPKTTKQTQKPTAYVLFCRTHRSQVTQENPGLETSEVTKLLATMWKEHKKKNKHV
jgi:high mobility group protein B4